jgi:hypothetical protein
VSREQPSPAAAAGDTGCLTHRQLSYPRYRDEAEHLDLGGSAGRR